MSQLSQNGRGHRRQVVPLQFLPKKAASLLADLAVRGLSESRLTFLLCLSRQEQCEQIQSNLTLFHPVRIPTSSLLTSMICFLFIQKILIQEIVKLFVLSSDSV